MSRRSMIALLAALILALAAGCGSIEHEWDQVTGDTQPDRYYEFPDIKIPGGMRLLTDQSNAFNVGGVRAGALSFEGRVVPESLANYFKDAMNMDGWRLEGAIKYPRTALFFSKPQKAALIQISEGNVYTKAVIWVLPVQR